MHKIKLLVMDVDGTLTDGKIYMGINGEVMKAFDVKDGCGIKDLLPILGIVPIIITARTSKILENRCIELGVDELYQGVRDKFEKLTEVCKKHNVKLSDVAYIGDDILDIQCMRPIKDAGGFVACPMDAVETVKEIADYITSCKGGNGAVRELVDRLYEFSRT